MHEASETRNPFARASAREFSLRHDHCNSISAAQNKWQRLAGEVANHTSSKQLDLRVIRMSQGSKEMRMTTGRSDRDVTANSMQIIEE